MIRLYFPIALFISALMWALYTRFIKKDITKAKSIMSAALFFGVIWGAIYYWLLI